MHRDRGSAALRGAFLALLVALAWERRGAPEPATLVALAALLAAAVALRMVVERLRRPPRELAPALALVAVLGTAGAAASWLGADGGIDVGWVALAGIPLALALVVPDPALVPRSRALAVLFFVALAFGLLAIEPWYSPTGRLLLGSLALLGTTAAALDVGRSVMPPGLPPPTATTRARAAATATLLAALVLLTSLGVDAALAPLPRVWERRPETAPPEDRLASSVRHGTAAQESAPEAALALVRVLDGDGEEVPDRLYLRNRVLDQPTDSDELIYLGPRFGTTALHRDTDDGVQDLRIRWSESREDGPGEGLTFQVTLLSDRLDALPVVPVPRWIEGRSLAVGADGALARPAGAAGASFSYRMAASPRAAFQPRRRQEAIAARNPECTSLPESFAGRAALEQVLGELPDGLQDDLSRVRTLSAHLRRTGRIDPDAPFLGWDEFLAVRAGKPVHFAQCFALLARLARVPARVAVGYCSDDYDETDRRFEVRARDEHYWGEVEIEGAGWIDLDPCPELAMLDPLASGARLAPERTDPKAVRKAFARERPLVVGLLLLLLVAAVLAFPSLRLELERITGPRPPAGMAGPARRAWRFWQELIDCCRRFGLEAHPAWTAEEFARLVGGAAPGEWSGLVRLLRVYHSCRFGGAELRPEEEQSSRELLSRLPHALQAWRSGRSDRAPSRR